MFASKKTIEKYEQEQNKMKTFEGKQTYKEIASNVVTIGKCGHCKSDLVYYIQSELENIFNYYCLGKKDQYYCRDVRYPLKKDFFLDESNNPLVTIKKLLKEFRNINLTEKMVKEIPVSKHVLIKGECVYGTTDTNNIEKAKLDININENVNKDINKNTTKKINNSNKKSVKKSTPKKEKLVKSISNISDKSNNNN